MGVCRAVLFLSEETPGDPTVPTRLRPTHPTPGPGRVIDGVKGLKTR